jgi:hypothetical protein
LFSHAAKTFGIVTKSTLELLTTVFCSAARRKFWNSEQKHCILLSRAAKNCGIANNSTAFCSATHRKNSELRTKAFFSVQPRSENFGIVTKSTVFVQLCSEIFGIANKKVLELRPKTLCSAAQRKNLNKKHSILFSRAAKMCSAALPKV